MTEICVQVFNELEYVQKKLVSLGYVLGDVFRNLDTYYTTFSKEKLKNINYTNLMDNTVLIRQSIGKDFDNKNIIYKKKHFDNVGNVIDEEKTKVVIDDVSKSKQIFENLNLTKWCDYRVDLYEYQLGEITIIIEYVKELGLFLEIEEYTSISQKVGTEKFVILLKLAQSLGFDLGSDFSVKKPYLFLQKTYN